MPTPLPEGANQDPVIGLTELRAYFTAAVVSDALDAEGYPNQAPRVPLAPRTSPGILIGRYKTTLWEGVAHPAPRANELELRAVGARQEDGGRSVRSVRRVVGWGWGAGGVSPLIPRGIRGVPPPARVLWKTTRHRVRSEPRCQLLQ